MLGAIMGDICGSPWEGGYCRDSEFIMFHPSAQITDDSVCTVAIADALLHGLPIADTLREWCRRYPGMGYGSMFNSWVYRPSMGPYESWGNGGAMRCSSCAWLAPSLAEAQRLAALTAAVTHNHPEGIRGARAIATAIWLARQGMAPGTIQQAIAAEGYQLGRSMQDWVDLSPGGTDAAETVPIAIDCALAASSLDDAIRRAVYIGGDTDTTASMAAAIAEARFGLFESYARDTLARVPSEMRAIVRAVYERAGVPMAIPDPMPADAPPAPSLWQKLLASFRS
ncbi:hypothetical protein LMG26857_03464 [Achromobacter anxifer]|uniref:ADP-ribosylglycohydrolase family protein n=1 Tax=Achromobacter anxifer TaxID=1287737 RepID=UPI00155D17A9|nr:ADP-ribosylglycohydrolase family protein [Achromobacter anxifer]CAB5514405.1 hypothetical protein LMG26857_03464 [Achromobacter anxifer]